MTDVRSASLNNSPTRDRTHTLDYRSPTYCDSDLYFTNPDLTARELNYMATPIEFFRRRTFRRNTIDRVIDQLTVQRPLTLHLGRFQLSIPRFGRNNEPRPDTPNVAEINIDDLDFVRLNSNDTYTLNGRTIRLLGANFENYPVVNGSRPPPYNEAMRQKYGPPPEYLSREGINNDNENEARSNVEMPPCYEDLASGVDSNANDISVNIIDVTDNTNDVNDNNDNNLFVTTVNPVSVDNSDSVNPVSNVPESISSVIDNLPAIDSDVNANDTYDNAVSVQ